MPSRAPRVCGHCGGVHHGRCPQAQAVDRARKARFDKTRPSSSQRGYTGAWDKARKAFLARHRRCAWPGCAEAAEHVDHIIPHRGDHGLFWDRSNWQPLCGPHHNSAKQRQERRAAQGSAP